MDGIDWDMIAAVAQVLGFGGIIWGLAQNRRTLQTQVAMEFYRRFAEIMDRMPARAQAGISGRSRLEHDPGRCIKRSRTRRRSCRFRET